MQPDNENGTLPTATGRTALASPNMEKSTTDSNSTLIFVYNAGSGLFNGLIDMAHKVFAPHTYQCNLCALTYSTFGMRKSWKRFIETLDRPLEFLHADELKDRYGLIDVPLPALFKKEDGRLKLLLDADSINACRTIDDLQQLVRGALPASGPVPDSL